MYAMWQNGRDPAVVNATRVLSMLEPGAATFYDKQHGEWSTAAFDNYFVRVLGGNDVYWLPAGAVNRTHLDTAKQVLQRYQVIMTLDTFDEDALQMSELLGWTVTALDMPEGGVPTLQQRRARLSVHVWSVMARRQDCPYSPAAESQDVCRPPTYLQPCCARED